MKTFLAMALSAATALMALPAVAQIHNVPAGGQREIDAHSACRIIRNAGGHNLMVGTNTAAEWSQGTNAFLNNIADIPNVSAAPCAPWWDGMGVGGAMFGGQGSMTQTTWADGTKQIIQPDSTTYRQGIGRPQSDALRSATYYNANTGACAPAKSYIGVGPILHMIDPHSGTLIAAVQLCNSDGKATGPFINMKDRNGNPIPDAPLPSYDYR